MNQHDKLQRIVIIGGRGPQASIHAQKRLQEILIANKKKAEIVHVSLVIDHFFDSKPDLNLSDRQRSLLASLEADVGFIACNTAHLFFEEISELVNFQLLGQDLLLSCTELSMLANNLNLKARCTLEETLKKIVGNV